MSTELTTINEDELNALAKATGASAGDLAGNNASFLPQLKVNYNEEDENKKELKKGTFYLTGQETNVYAKNVTIRPLLQHYQWTSWDDVAKKNDNRTRLIVNFNEEARDEKGGIKCGKPDAKTIKANPDMVKAWKHVKCVRIVHALVYYTGVDADGNEHTVDGVLATIRLKGANFNGLREEFIDKMPKNGRLWDYEINLGTTREKTDPTSATYFYVTHYDADFTKRIPMTNDVFAVIKEAQAVVNEFNASVDVAYYKAIDARSKGADSDAKSDNAIDAIANALDQDFIPDDDIPF